MLELVLAHGRLVLGEGGGEFVAAVTARDEIQGIALERLNRGFDRGPPGQRNGRGRQAVAGVGGNVLPKNELTDFLEEKHEVASGIPDEFDGSLDLAQIALPQDLAGLDVFITRAEVGVAENGALWVPEHRLVHRAAAFIAQQVVVLIEPGALVGDMHQAYRAIEVRASGFGVFISGPSKTADIEQSLVLGAHGPRGLTVVLG